MSDDVPATGSAEDMIETKQMVTFADAEAQWAEEDREQDLRRTLERERQARFCLEHQLPATSKGDATRRSSARTR